MWTQRYMEELKAEEVRHRPVIALQVPRDEDIDDIVDLPRLKGLNNKKGTMVKKSNKVQKVEEETNVVLFRSHLARSAKKLAILNSRSCPENYY